MLEDGVKSQLAEAKRVRLVLCPKCRKLLPELSGSGIYQCGGCSTILQAKNSASFASPSSEKLNNGMMLKFDDRMIQKSMDGKRKNGADFAEDRALLAQGSNGSPVSIIDSNECGGDPPSPLIKESPPDSSPRDDRGMRRVEVAANAIVPVGIYKDLDDDANFTDAPNYQRRTKKEILGTESQNTYGDNGGHHLYKTPSESQPWVSKGKTKIDAKLDRVERTHPHRDEIGDGRSRVQRTSRASSYGFHAPLYIDEGRSRNSSNSRFRDHKYSNSGFSDGVGHHELDETEILRKLDELRDELLQCKIGDYRTEDQLLKNRRVHSRNADQTGGTRGWITEATHSSNSHSTQQFPSARGYDLSINSYRRTSPAREQMFMSYDPQASPVRTSFKSSHRGMESTSKFSTYEKSDPFFASSRTRGMFSKNPSCSCEHYHDNNTIVYERSPYLVGNRENLSGGGSYGRKSTHPLGRSDRPWHNFKSSNSMRNERSCQPFQGGAPYIVCNNCFEILVLPYGFMWERNRGKLWCGECSKVIIVIVHEKRLRVAEPALVDRMTDGPQHQISEEVDRSSQNIPSAVKNIEVSTPIPTVSDLTSDKGHYLELSKTEIEERMPSPSGTSKDGSPNIPIYQEDGSKSEDIPKHNSDKNPHDHDSSDIDDPFSPSSDNRVIKYVFGNIAEISKQDKNTAPVNANYRIIPTKAVLPSATELDLSPNEYPNLDLSQDSQDGRKEFTGFSFDRGDFQVDNEHEQKDNQPTQSLDTRRYKVSINGHPISNKNVKKAIKQAGPVQSGDYWYDYQAGFWGIMGGPCLGIILPCIKEFDFPMHKKCAGGDTGIIVNGRELHRIDLELLVGRGLPSSKDRSYIVEISGLVWDATSGEEVGNLGKLAPTVEKFGRGFGMRAPRVKT